MNQVAFALKLKGAILAGNITREQLDMEVKLDGSVIVWPRNSFRSRDDVVILAENTANMALASLAIAADEELDKHFGNRHHGQTQFPNNVRTIIHQIRNAFAHSLLVPTWQVREKYRKPYVYESEGISICLDFRILDGQRLDWAQFNGFDHFWSLFEQAQRLVCPAGPTATPPAGSTSS
jgi:hypothetical protein